MDEKNKLDGQSMVETITQLASYSSWRDTETSILLFIKNKNFSDILNQITPTARKHPNFVQKFLCEDETSFRFVFTHKDDPNRRLYLSVLAFAIPT